MTSSTNWAVVTPSYNLDLERCKLLCASMDAFLSGPWHHYIVVDPVDLPLFAPLAGPRRSVINKADILPKGMRFLGKVPFMRLGRLWGSWRHGLVFGWQMQQFVKILIASHVNEYAMAFCDSDVFFVRPFDIGRLARGDQIRFNSDENFGGPQDSIVNASIELLGLSDIRPTRFAWGDALVTWHRATVIAMQDYLSKLHHKPWHEAIGSRFMFSEYHLYCLFVNYIQKDNPFLYEDNTVYCKVMWSKEQAKQADVAAFCADLQPEQVAVCIQSLIGLDIKLLQQQFEAALTRQGLVFKP